MNWEIYEKGLPGFLQKDIDNLIAENGPIDCLLDEVYGSINSAYHGGEITKECAEYLRRKYLGFD